MFNQNDEIFGGREHVESIHERIRSVLDEQQLDVAVLRTRANFAWMTGGRDNHIINTSELGVAFLLVFKDRVLCVTTSMEERRIQEEELSALGIEVISGDWTRGIEVIMESLLKGLRVGTDGLQSGTKDLTVALSKARQSLSIVQIAQYREVCGLAVNTIESIGKRLHPGLTEHVIAADLASAVMTGGGTPVVTLVATDERIMRYRHPIPTHKPLLQYAMLVLCVQKYGLVANVTRFVHLGKLPHELDISQKQCASIDVRMNAMTQKGVRVGDVFQAGLAGYADIGYPDDWKLLHQGGPTGYASREYLATMNSDQLIDENQAFAWNPAIRGFKSEDTLLVNSTGNEFLTHSGEWAYQQVQYDGRMYERPAIWVID